MPENYTKVQLGQLITAIWSKYFLLQGGDIATQRQLLDKDKEIFQKDKELQQLKLKLEEAKSNNPDSIKKVEFQVMLDSGKIDNFIKLKDVVFNSGLIDRKEIKELADVMAFGLLEDRGASVGISKKGIEFFKWYILENPIKAALKNEA